MRTAVGSRQTTTVQPAVTVHQPSIRARDAAHDVVFDRRRSSDRRGWASQSVSRSRATINHPENARTGTAAVRPPGSSRRSRPRLHRNARLEARTLGTASAAELVIVDLIAQHDVEPDEEAPGQGHLRFGPAAPPKDGEVDPLESSIASGRERCRLAEHPAQERAALFADMPQPVLVRGRADGGRQPDVAWRSSSSIWPVSHCSSSRLSSRRRRV
jgi:hypothetical protein